jgi:kynurenine formamidase
MFQSQPATRWQRRPPRSNWGDFGPDDRIGRMNLLTPQRRKAAAAEVREGLAFCLSLPLDVGAGLNRTRRPPRLAAIQREGRPKFNLCACEVIHPGLTDVMCDDEVTLSTQFSTQWDALCHVGSMFDADADGVPEIRYYNGFPAIESFETSPLGIQHMAATAVQGRGVLVDLAHHFGPGRTVVGHAQLIEVLRSDQVAIEEGDLVCLHTGFAQAVLDDASGRHNLESVGAVLDGADSKLLEWITDSGLAALIADNVAVEGRATGGCDGYRGPMLPLHEHCLFKLGVHLGEMWQLGPLAGWLRSHGRSRFLLTAPPLRLPGAMGSPLTPVATV